MCQQAQANGGRKHELLERLEVLVANAAPQELSEIEALILNLELVYGMKLVELRQQIARRWWFLDGAGEG